MIFNFSTWLPESLSNKNYILRDIIAGTTIAMIIIPQSMAYAALADVSPVYGLYAALIPVGIAAFFGSSRYLATGPVAMVCLLTSVAITSLSAGDASLYIFYAIILAITVGVFQIILALLSAGKIFDTIPEHVLLGFTSAAALIISTSQLSKVFGMPKVSLGQLADIDLLLANSPINYEAFGLSILVLLIMYIIKYKFTKFMTLSNLAVFFAVLFSISYSLSQSYTGPIVGFITPGLPDFKIPDFGIFNGSLPMLIIHTLIIAFVGFMEAIAIAKQLYSKKPPKDSNGVELYKNPTPVDSNQELLGQGVANISSGISGSIPVSGSFSRSAVNEASGAYSGLSSIVTMVVVGITLLFATPLLFNLPQATLGIIVIFAVIPLIRVKEMSKLYFENKRLGIITWLTFASTLLFPILSIELYEGITTHIWTGIIFGFLIHVLFARKHITD
ncbi:MAG: SulP family inorganic anion transporter [Gammaproteobacteria bacterium]|jgi:sulfate permease, SulP family|nr:SulP family inorganic anion transporter [Gammaproteobacteria bacterium]MBT4655291.1 SulP family inorganic anion transporter [Gammaproteobacteria bacterium]MBT5117217.1 SulP family inorganic anion transporter [Gammaproteobacteria bacterium]MBT5762106.1 SulP family inorganic anion transporter [Gammaproteobacteria bacterium]MBT6331681.1 SulP family inorganic anion transporter [Gammaproteobacteria bacterium]